MGSLAISAEHTICMPPRAPNSWWAVLVEQVLCADSTRWTDTPPSEGNAVLSVTPGFCSQFLFKLELTTVPPLPGLSFLLILKRAQGFLRLCS